MWWTEQDGRAEGQEKGGQDTKISLVLHGKMRHWLNDGQHEDGWPFPCGCFFKFILVEYLDLMKGESLRLPEQLVNLLPIKVLPQRPHLAMAEFHCHPFQSVFPLLPCYCSDGGIVNYSPSWMKNPSELILVLFPIVLLMITQLPCRHSRA